MNSIYSDDERVLELTRKAMALSGSRIFQIHKLAASDDEHVAALLALFNPPRDAKVLDLGCGVGGVAAPMRALRPDLAFTLVNVSRNQLALCPDDMAKVHASLEETGLPDESFDAAFIGYALGHVDLTQALMETWRLLRPGGVLFIYDLVAPDPAALQRALGYAPPSLRRLLQVACDIGFDLHWADVVTREHNRDFLKLRASAEALWALSDAVTVAARFRRQ